MTGRNQRTTTVTKLDKYIFHKEQEAAAATANVENGDTQGEKPREVTLLDVMATLQQVQMSIGTVSTNVTLLRADVAKINTRIREVEIKIAALTEDTATLQLQVSDLQLAHKQMMAKLDDQEGRSRRNNTSLVGIPESVKGPALELIVEDIIQIQLQPRGLSNFFSVERAHRVPGGRPRPGALPRPVLARLLNFRDRDVILQVARVAPPIKIDNSIVSIYPDYTAAVSEQRRTFMDIKKELRQRKLKYSMLYPAKL